MKLGFVCFRMRTVSRNHTDEVKIPSKGTDSPSGSFPISTSVQFISVWVRVENLLGSAESSVINYTLSDIGKTHINCSSPEISVCKLLGNLFTEKTHLCSDSFKLFVLLERHCDVYNIKPASVIFSTHSVICFITVSIAKTMYIVCPAGDTLSRHLFLVYLTSLINLLIWPAMPPRPELVQPECSSRDCTIKVKQSVRTQHLEIQYTAGEQTWTIYPDQVIHINFLSFCVILCVLLEILQDVT